LRKPAKSPQPDRSVADFLLDHYGQESHRLFGGSRCWQASTAAILGQMSVNSVLGRFVEIETKYGSLTRGVLAAPRPKGSGSLFRTLKNGLGQLVEALSGNADIVHGEVESLERTGPGFRAEWPEIGSKPITWVLATPASDAARLLQPWNGNFASLLESIPYNLRSRYRSAIAGHFRSSTQGFRISGA